MVNGKQNSTRAKIDGIGGKISCSLQKKLGRGAKKKQSGVRCNFQRCSGHVTFLFRKNGEKHDQLPCALGSPHVQKKKNCHPGILKQKRQKNSEKTSTFFSKKKQRCLALLVLSPTHPPTKTSKQRRFWTLEFSTRSSPGYLLSRPLVEGRSLVSKAKNSSSLKNRLMIRGSVLIF